ncbi:MAG: GNAT family N-acetyltransferase [Pirellulales bacterium]
MSLTYFKRYRMELKLDQYKSNVQLPRGFQLVPWSPRLVLDHADVKFESFREEIDSHVFPCLGDLDGCRNLMHEIAGRKDFIPAATWLLSRDTEFNNVIRPVGTIQGLRASQREGAIQNIGVHPDFRGLGLGTSLIDAALKGFQLVGCKAVYLEVTVQNTAAIRLYERLGFRRVETLFKIADVQFA